MAKRRLPFETQFSDPGQEHRWLEELERVGPESCPHAIESGSRALLRGIGLELNVTKGFAEDWLRYKESIRRRWRIAGWGATFAVAIVAVFAALVSDG